MYIYHLSRKLAILEHSTLQHYVCFTHLSKPHCSVGTLHASVDPDNLTIYHAFPRPPKPQLYLANGTQ